MVGDKKVSKVQKFLFYKLSFSRKFVETFFISSIISSNVITESSKILPTYLLFSQLYVAGFWI